MSVVLGKFCKYIRFLNSKPNFNYFRVAEPNPIKTSCLNKLFAQLLLTCLLLHTGSTFAQVIKSKDGKVLGEQKDIVRACVEAAKQEVVKLHNVEFKLKDYCNCMATGVLPNLTMKEVENAIANNSFQQLLLREDNFSIFQECAANNMIIDSAFDMSEQLNQAQLRPFFVKKCVDGIFMDEGVEEFISKGQAAQICNCTLDKLIEKGYTYGQITALSDSGSPEFEEIVMGCLPTELIEEMQEE